MADETKDIRDARGRFKPGASGNPTGTHRKVIEPELPSESRLDGWVGQNSGIGDDSRDKRRGHYFQTPAMSYDQCVNLWRSFDVAAKAVEHLGHECFRRGYEFDFTDQNSTIDDIKMELEEDMQDLEVDDAIEWAMNVERGLGGSAILKGVDDNRKMIQPVEGDGKGLDWLKVLEPLELTPWAYYEDPSKPKYGQPEVFLLSNFYRQSGGRAPTVKDTSIDPLGHLIHESRLEIFRGVRVSEYQEYGTSELDPFWGDSIYVRLEEILRDFGIVWSSAGILATDFAPKVLSMSNLMGLIAKHPAKVQARARALNMTHSTAGITLIDEKEKFERHSTNLSGFADLLDRLSSRTSAGIGIPFQLLMQNPREIGDTTSGIVRFYYDTISSYQNRRVSRRVKRFAKMLMHGRRQRKLPTKKWGPKWHELWQLTERERAESKLVMARVDSMYIKAGVLTPDEVRKSRFFGGFSFETHIEENKKAPGFLPPLPKGVLPGSTPAAAAPGAPAPQGPNAHGVQGYARRNPTGGGQDDQSSDGDATPDSRADMDGPGTKVISHGLPIIIESPRGSVRTWVDTDGTPGETKMRYDYGYVENSIGTDGDSVDVYLGPSASEWVFVIHQTKKPEFVEHDEDKVMIGFSSADHAKDAYITQYDDPRFYGGMSIMHLEDFRRKLRFSGKITNA